MNTTYEIRRDTIVMHAWETWTRNGLTINPDHDEETIKTVQDAVNNTFTDDISDLEWLAATLQKLQM